MIHQTENNLCGKTGISSSRIAESINIVLGLVVLFLLIAVSLPDTLVTIGIALGSFVFCMAIIRRKEYSGFRLGFMFFVAVLVAERISVAQFLWDQSTASTTHTLWRYLVAPLGMVIIYAFTLKKSSILLSSVAILFTGLPYIPADHSAFVSIPVLLIASYSLYGRGIPKPALYMVAGIAVVAVIYPFLPCPEEAMKSVVLSLLFIAGYIIASSSQNEESLPAISMVLLLPIAIGLLYQIIGGERALTGWGVNINPLAAQAGIGFLILMHMGRRNRLRMIFTGICAILILLVFRSGWTIISFVVAACLIGIRNKRIITSFVILMVLMPLLTLGVLLLSDTQVVPETIRVSILSRQYHWASSIAYISNHPFGSALTDVHPHALGLVEPPDELLSITGMKMQHAHHFLLDCGERLGIPGILFIVLMVGIWFKGIVRTVYDPRFRWSIAGFLFLWMHNAADFSWSWPVLIILAGMCIGYSLRITIKTAGGCISRCVLGLVMIIGFHHWGSGMLGAGISLSTVRGNTTLAEHFKSVRTFLTPAGSRPMRDVLSEPEMYSRLCVPESFACIDSAEQLIRGGRLHEAQPILELILRTDPRGVLPDVGGPARVYLSEIKRENGDKEDAVELLRDLKWTERNTVRISRRIAYALLRNRRTHAVRIFRQTSRRIRDKADLNNLTEELRRLDILGVLWGSVPARDQRTGVFNSIERDIDAGRVKLAATRAEQITGEIRNTWQYISLLSKIARARGNIDESIQLASRAAAMSNNADAARWDLINALVTGNRHEEALTQIDIHIRKHPEDAEARIKKARILLDIGHAADARKVIQTAMKSGADELSGGIVKAQALKMEGKERAGRRILLNLTRKYPTSSWPYWELGRWAEEAGALGKAKTYASQAVERSPEDPGCRLLLARVLRRMKKFNEARKHLSVILENKRGGVGWVIDAQHELSYIDSLTLDHDR